MPAYIALLAYVVQMTDKSMTPRNGLLSRLPLKEMRTLQESSEHIDLPLSFSMFEANKPINHVYFITSGVASVVKAMDDGTNVEVATVGPEGMVGIELLLGPDNVDYRGYMQVPGEGLRIKASTFRKLLTQAPKLNNLLMRYTVALMNQMAQSAACNRTHAVDERCARWLLMTHDRVRGDNFPLTQEFLAQMLGVHRPTVSVAAAMLQKAGFIEYSRGVIAVKNRKGLESAACACYRSIANEYERLLG